MHDPACGLVPHAPELGGEVCSVGHEPPGLDPIASIEDCRQPRAERKCEDARAVGGRESIGHNIKCVGLDLERREGGSDVLRSPDFPCVDLKAERASRCTNLAHLPHAGGIVDINDDCQQPEAGDNLT